MKYILRLIIVILITSACSSNFNITKRKYRKGYSISSYKQNNKQKIENKQLTKALASMPSIEDKVNEFDWEKENNNFQADLGNQINLGELKKKSFNSSNEKNYIQKISPDTCGDVITLTSGVTIKCKVDEINELIVKYKNCENLNGPSYTIKKVSISSIVYANGTKEDLTKAYVKEAKPKIKYEKKPEHFVNEAHNDKDKIQSELAKKYGKASIASFFSIILVPVLPLIGFIGFITFFLIFVFCPLAFYYGAKVLKRKTFDDNKNPEIKKAAKFGYNIGLAFFIGWTAAALIAALISVFIDIVFVLIFVGIALIFALLGLLIYKRA